MKKAVRLYVSGNIQGVFYRAFVKENAEKLNIKGFVRNLEDRRVEVFLEGDYENMKKIIDICNKGPRHAQIRNVEQKTERVQDFKTFKVLHI